MALEENVESWLRSQARSSFRLVPSSHPTATYLGGTPSMPSDFAWPRYKTLPMAFLGQIDLGEASAVGDTGFLPRVGRLLFFYDPMQSVWGDKPADNAAWRVLYVGSQATQSTIGMPADMPAEGDFARRDMTFVPAMSYPSLDRAADAFAGVDIDTVYEGAIAKLESDSTEPHHKLLGWPEPVQTDDMELASQFAFWGVHGMQGTMEHDWARPGAGKWHLLAQIDSDDDIGMMWGDVGRLYFFVRRDDAANADFSKVWMHLQCY